MLLININIAFLFNDENYKLEMLFGLSSVKWQKSRNGGFVYLYSNVLFQSKPEAIIDTDCSSPAIHSAWSQSWHELTTMVPAKLFRTVALIINLKADFQTIVKLLL